MEAVKKTSMKVALLSASGRENKIEKEGSIRITVDMTLSLQGFYVLMDAACLINDPVHDRLLCVG